MELEESTVPISDYSTKLQSSKQYGTSRKQKYRPKKQDRKLRHKPAHLGAGNLWQRRQDGKMEKSLLVSDVRETGQLGVL